MNWEEEFSSESSDYHNRSKLSLSGQETSSRSFQAIYYDSGIITLRLSALQRKADDQEIGAPKSWSSNVRIESGPLGRTMFRILLRFKQH